jgi:outer membrane lipoprotein-sorting protein
VEGVLKAAGRWLGAGPLMPRFFRILVLFFLLVSSWKVSIAAGAQIDAQSLLQKMNAAYSDVVDYRTKVEVKDYWSGDDIRTKVFLYTFKKPDRIRIDIQQPYPGMVLIYPDKNGEFVVAPSKWTLFMTLHLIPDSFLLKTAAGQRLDRTDLGLLIRNIARSVTDQRRGPLEIAEQDAHILVKVLAENHFRRDLLTLYRFVIDKQLRLPVAVSESTQDGTLEREVTFQDLRLNTGVPDSYFRPAGDGN